MAYKRVSSLFVLTLLQLCRAEISDSSPESWYSANVINDGFQPKSISEIFSTESPFSSTNPIVVLPKQSSSVPDEILLLSTLPPLRKISTTGSSTDYTKNSVIGLQTSSPRPITIQTIPPPTFQSTPSTFASTPSTLSTFASTPSTFPSTLSTLQGSTQTQTTPQIISQFTETQPSSQLLAVQPVQQTSFVQPQQRTGGSRSAQTQSQQIRLELVPQGQNLPEQIVTTQQQQSQTSTAGPLSNYFLIYQQAPQSIQGFPGAVGTSQEIPQVTAASQGPTTREPSTVIIQPAPSVSPPSTRTAPPTSTTLAPSTVRVQSAQIPRANRNNCQNVTALNATPKPQLPAVGGLMPLKIRVVAPSGSITHVNFNTAVKTTTTKRPTTTRTRKTPKPKRNTYESCTDGCKGRREPICAAPLTTPFLDPNTLKGFPSICHMSCHNSYRKDPYEKLVDGRCGRLRTRIKTFDSNTKLKREELNKAQYVIDNSGTKTIVEFSGLNK